MIRCRFCEREFPELPESAIVLRVKPNYVLVQFQERGKPVHQFNKTDLANPPEPHIEEPGMIVIPAPVQTVDTVLEIDRPEPRTLQPEPWPWITDNNASIS
jgi:hypothetical protein